MTHPTPCLLIDALNFPNVGQHLDHVWKADPSRQFKRAPWVRKSLDDLLIFDYRRPGRPARSRV